MNGTIRVESIACDHCGQQAPIADIQRFPGCKRPVFDCLLCPACLSACIECCRPSIEQCDDCGLPVCNWSVSASIQGPAESCWQQHIAGHVAEENEAYVAEMEGGTL